MVRRTERPGFQELPPKRDETGRSLGDSSQAQLEQEAAPAIGPAFPEMPPLVGVRSWQ